MSPVKAVKRYRLTTGFLVVVVAMLALLLAL